MRKITSESVRAFYNGESYKNNNTEVKIDGVSNKLYLHGNLIAELKNSEEGKNLYISSAGWTSDTTKERLNGVLNGKGLYIKGIKWVWFLCSSTNRTIEMRVDFKEGNSLNGVTIF